MQITNQINDIQLKIQELEKIKHILFLINFFEQTQEVLKKLGLAKINVCLVSGNGGWDANFNLHYSYSIDKNGKKKDFFPKVSESFKKNGIESVFEHKSIKNTINFNRGHKEVFVTLNMTIDEFVGNFAHDTYKEVYTQWKSVQIKERLEQVLPINCNIKPSVKI